MKYRQKDFERFFEGELSKKEAREFVNWVHSKGSEVEIGSIIEEVWEQENTETKPGADQPKSLIPLHDRGIMDFDPLFPKTVPKKPRHFRIWFGMAATVAIVVVFGFAYYLSLSQETLDPIEVIAEVTKVTKSTERAQRKIILLPDGSKATLNAESKIEYGADFQTNRSILLEGEAFFEVKKDNQHPFTVTSQNITTTALGTSFNIRAYGHTSQIQVALATGKVLVEDNLNTAQFEIQPGERVMYDPFANSFEKSAVDLKGVLSWREGVLHFEKVPFNIILEDLERWYGVEFTFSGKSKTPTLLCSGTFGPNEYLSNVLKALSYSVDFGYRIDDKTVSLDFNPDKPMQHPINDP